LCTVSARRSADCACAMALAPLTHPLLIQPYNQPIWCRRQCTRARIIVWCLLIFVWKSLTLAFDFKCVSPRPAPTTGVLQRADVCHETNHVYPKALLEREIRLFCDAYVRPTDGSQGRALGRAVATCSLFSLIYAQLQHLQREMTGGQGQRGCAISPENRTIVGLGRRMRRVCTGHRYMSKNTWDSCKALALGGLNTLDYLDYRDPSRTRSEFFSLHRGNVSHQVLDLRWKGDGGATIHM